MQRSLSYNVKYGYFASLIISYSSSNDIEIFLQYQRNFDMVPFTPLFMLGIYHKEFYVQHKLSYPDMYMHCKLYEINGNRTIVDKVTTKYIRLYNVKIS